MTRIRRGALPRIAGDVRRRLDALFETKPIPYRTQNGGDYDIPSMELKLGLSAGRHGLDIHFVEE